MRYNLYRSAQINGFACPWLQFRTSDGGARRRLAKTMPPDMGYDYLGMSSRKKGPGRLSPAAIFGLSLLFVFLILARSMKAGRCLSCVLLAPPSRSFGAFAGVVARQMVNNVMRRSAW